MDNAPWRKWGLNPGLPLTRPTPHHKATRRFCLLCVRCLMSKQNASVSQGRICSDNFTCWHIGIEVADQTVYLTQSQYTDTGRTSPSADTITPGTRQGNHYGANVEVTGWLDPDKSRCKWDSNPGSSALAADALTTKLTRRCGKGKGSGETKGKQTRNNTKCVCN